MPVFIRKIALSPCLRRSFYEMKQSLDFATLAAELIRWPKTSVVAFFNTRSDRLLFAYLLATGELLDHRFPLAITVKFFLKSEEAALISKADFRIIV